MVVYTNEDMVSYVKCITNRTVVIIDKVGILAGRPVNTALI